MDHRIITRAALALLGAASLGACSVNTAPPTVSTPAVVAAPATAVVPVAPPSSTVVVQPRTY